MTFQQLIPYLNERNFHPGTITEDGEVVGLHLDCVSLHQKEFDLQELGRALMRTGYEATYFPNLLKIHIIKKK